MGCCETASVPKLTPESRISEFEDKLEIRMMPAERVDRVIHRYSSSLKISQIQFEMIFKELQLLKSSLAYSYFQMFYNENEDAYEARELSSVGIVYCSGTDQEKITLLFQNYDLDSSKSLISDEIKEMVADLTNIAVSYSSGFMITNAKLNGVSNGEVDSFIEYRKEMISLRPILMSYYNSQNKS